jgi:hypothetical protein
MKSLFLLLLSSICAGVFAFSTSMTLKLDPVKGEVGRLNTIFIIDNSGSMQPHQDEIVRTVDTYFKKMSAMTSDYALTVISTDVNESMYGITSNKDPNAEGSFASMVRQLGTNGSYEEKPLQALLNNLPLLNTNGFFDLAGFTNVIIVTDEEDQSNMDIKSLLSSLNKVTRSNMMINAFLGDESCPQSTSAAPILEDLTAQTGGSSYKICGDYRASFEDMLNKVPKNKNILTLPQNEISLPYLPIVGSIEVRFGSQIIPFGYYSSGWVYDDLNNKIIFGNEVKLDQYQPEGSKIEISFEIDPSVDFDITIQ